MEDADIFRHEGNSICGDDITVYLKIVTKPQSNKATMSEEHWSTEALKHWSIEAFSYDGNTSMITTAAASFFSELIIDRTIQEALTMTYENTMVPEWFEVTPRRKRAWAIAILAMRNALHSYLQDEKIDTWDDVVEI